MSPRGTDRCFLGLFVLLPVAAVIAAVLGPSGRAPFKVTQPLRDPDVALADVIDGEAAPAPAGLAVSWSSTNVEAASLGYSDPLPISEPWGVTVNLAGQAVFTIDRDAEIELARTHQRLVVTTRNVHRLVAAQGGSK